MGKGLAPRGGWAGGEFRPAAWDFFVIVLSISCTLLSLVVLVLWSLYSSSLELLSSSLHGNEVLTVGDPEVT